MLPAVSSSSIGIACGGEGCRSGDESGDAESLNELSDGFATAITADLMMVYAVLVLLFGTFLQPIPTSCIGWRRSSKAQPSNWDRILARRPNHVGRGPRMPAIIAPATARSLAERKAAPSGP
jgi:hypothetical protein